MNPYAVYPSWNPIADLQLLWQYHFMQNAFLAGTAVSLVAGVAGYFMVVRAQAFAGHALAHVGFAGAAGALLFGFSPVAGMLAVSTSAALGIGIIEQQQKRRVGDGIPIAAVFTFSLGLGLLCLQLYAGQAEDAYAILFGAVLGVTDRDVALIAATAGGALVALSVMARPLMFASIDPDVARARGVPVGFLSIAFLVVLAFAVAEAVQVVGVLLIFALLVTPAATAQRLTARPARAVLLSVVLALSYTWLGLSIAYFAPHAVVGFYVTSLAFGGYLLVRVGELVASQVARNFRRPGRLAVAV